MSTGTNKTAVFPSRSFGDRFGSMFRVDMRRMLTTSRFYIMLGCAFIMPVLILVMTTMVSGTAITDPNTGMTQTMDAFTNTWQIIAQESSAGMAMDMTAMCNINLMYFMAGIFTCLFVADDFASGYSKNLFTVRARKGDYVASKTLACFIAGSLFLLAFFLGSVFGGAAAGLPFTLGAGGIAGLIMCMMAKIFLMAVFVSIFLLMSVFGKHRAWLSIMLALFGGMLLFMMIPMMTPLDSGIMHVGLCLAGGAIFAAAIGRASRRVMMTTSLVG
ncbi:MAG: ABC transporter permease [Lachnospiraceae bacterium]|nr:ABC transporter permease [Lachnospiraceae bacterium]